MCTLYDYTVYIYAYRRQYYYIIIIIPNVVTNERYESWRGQNYDRLVTNTYTYKIIEINLKQTYIFTYIY